MRLKSLLVQRSETVSLCFSLFFFFVVCLDLELLYTFKKAKIKIVDYSIP